MAALHQHDQTNVMEKPKAEDISNDGDGRGIHTVESVDLGHTVKPTQKPFTAWSAMSLGYSISNTGIGMVLVAGNTVFGAGPLFIWGTLVVPFVTFCVAITLGELASAYPHAGGQYFWTAQLSSERTRRFLSYMTAIVSWASVVCTGASAVSGMVNTIFAIVSIQRPDFVYHQWMGFLLFLACNWTAALMVRYERIIPTISNTFVAISLVTVTTTFICLLAPSSEKQSAAVVFGGDGGYFNLSGWPDGVAFLVGISGINWGFSCLDAATHLAEEIPEPRKNIPKALLWTVGIACLSGLLVNLAIFFAATDLEKTISILGLLYEVYGNPTCATVLGVFISVSVWGSVIGIHTWQSRIVWSLSRDRGFPFHSRMSQLAPSPFHTPMWAILWGTCWISLCGFLFLGSTVAFNSFISAGIVLQYMTYATPTILLLIKGRGTLEHGPFWWPRFGPIANLVVVSWTFLITVMYSFPLFLPVEAASMNYLACVLAFAFIYAGLYWVLYGAKHYRLVDLRIILG